MSITKIFDIAGSALNAQMVRMNLSASNLANATTAASSPEDAFKAKRAVFRTMLDDQTSNSNIKYFGYGHGLISAQCALDAIAFILDKTKSRAIICGCSTITSLLYRQLDGVAIYTGIKWHSIF